MLECEIRSGEKINYKRIGQREYKRKGKEKKTAKPYFARRQRSKWRLLCNYALTLRRKSLMLILIVNYQMCSFALQNILLRFYCHHHT